mgnify:CR=1 FL=1
MGDFSFQLSDLIVWVGACAPAVVALFGFYSRLNKFILKTDSVNAEQTKYIKDLTDRMELRGGKRLSVNVKKGGYPPKCGAVYRP